MSILSRLNGGNRENAYIEVRKDGFYNKDGKRIRPNSGLKIFHSDGIRHVTMFDDLVPVIYPFHNPKVLTVLEPGTYELA